MQLGRKTEMEPFEKLFAPPYNDPCYLYNFVHLPTMFPSVQHFLLRVNDSSRNSPIPDIYLMVISSVLFIYTFVSVCIIS